jgi:hypothetical protein
MGQYGLGYDLRNQTIVYDIPPAASSMSDAANTIIDIPTEAAQIPGAATSIILNNWPDQIPNAPQYPNQPQPDSTGPTHYYVDKCGNPVYLGNGTPPPGSILVW